MLIYPSKMLMEVRNMMKYASKSCSEPRFLAGKPSILQNIFLGHRYEEPTGADRLKNRAVDDQPAKNQWRLAIRRSPKKKDPYTMTIEDLYILSVDQYT